MRRYLVVVLIFISGVVLFFWQGNKQLGHRFGVTQIIDIDRSLKTTLARGLTP